MVVPEVARWLARHPAACAVFVDDGSRDGTPEAIERACQGCSEAPIRLHRSPHNRGKGAVVREAMLASRAEIICFTDGDLAYSLDHVDRLIEALERPGVDVAIGSRALVTDGVPRPSWRRRLSGWIFNLAARMVLRLPYSDTQAGLKGFRAPAAKRIFARSRVDGFAFDAELLYLAQREQLRIVEIPARVAPEHAAAGSSVSLLVDPWRMFAALLRVRRLHRAHEPAPTAPVPGARSAP